MIGGLHGLPQPLSAQEREDRLQRWRSHREEYIARGSAHLLGVLLAGMQLSITSRRRFITGPRLTVVFHDCAVVDHVDDDALDTQTLVEPVLGRRRDPLWYVTVAPVPLPASYPVRWEAADRAVRVTLAPAELHPDTTWTTDDDDFCVVARSDGPTVRMTWTLTEQGNDEVYTGEREIPVDRFVDAFTLYRELARRESGAD